MKKIWAKDGKFVKWFKLRNLKNQRKTTNGTLLKITLIKKSKGFTNQYQAFVLPKSKPNPRKQYQYKYGD